MGLEGSYEPGAWGTSNEHVERYERSGGTKGDAAVRLYRRRRFVEVLRRGEGIKMILVLD